MNKWFKTLGMSLAVVLVLSVIAGVSLAQGPVDDNGDGLCDECGEELGDGLMLGPRYGQSADPQGVGRGEAHRDSFVDEDGDGVCDDFVDVDGDGVCDECGMAYAGEERGPRYVQNGDPQGLGRDSANGDGLCDNEGRYAERSLGGRDGSGGRGNWNQSQGQGLSGRNRS